MKTTIGETMTEQNNELLQEIYKHVSNGKPTRFDWAKVLIPTIALLVTLGGLLIWIGSWRSTVDTTQSYLKEDVSELCSQAKSQKEKVWKRLDTDKDDRQEIINSVKDMSHKIDSIDVSQRRVESDIQEIKEAVKK